MFNVNFGSPFFSGLFVVKFVFDLPRAFDMVLFTVIPINGSKDHFQKVAEFFKNRAHTVTPERGLPHEDGRNGQGVVQWRFAGLPRGEW